MGNNFESMMRLVIPGIFLLIWAVNQLFNKELNPGANRLPAPGPRQGGLPPAPRPMDRSAPPQPRDPTMRFGTQATTERRGNDEVLVIRSEPIRPQATPQARPGAPRPAARPRQAAAPARKPDTVASRSQMTGVSQSVSQSIKLVGDVGQLTVAQSLAVDAGASAATAQDPSLAGSAALDGLRRVLANPTRLREAWMLSEILKPPVALRGRPRI